jgi:CotH kinase protein
MEGGSESDAGNGVPAVDNVIDQGQFREYFADRAIVVADVPAGTARDLAAKVNEPAGPGDATLRTQREINTLFDSIRQEAGPEHGAPAGDPPTLQLVDGAGAATAAGQLVDAYRTASIGKEEFFHQPMYLVAISDWPPADMRPDQPVAATGDARVAIWRTDPQERRPVPGPPGSGVLFSSATFSLVNSGNKTKYAPKRSWKIDVEPGDDDDRIVGMARLNLKSMYNDPSQMREALAWWLFGQVGVPAARHSYSRLAINGRYQGLYSLIEQVDRGFLRDHFGKNHRGNLYKAYCGDVGCATLEHRAGRDGDDSGRQYFTPGHPDLTYRLKTNEDDAAANTYDDLAQLIRVINSGRYETDTFRESIEGILNVRAFLRWAGTNVLLGSWDNYYATPSNYYLYNSGRRGGAKKFLASPYFTFIPWDYDNSLGIDYFGTSWQYTDLLDWPANTKAYNKNRGTSHIPLVQHLLANHELAQYYLDHLEHLLDTHFNTTVICARMGTPDGAGLWQRVAPSAYLEADFPSSPAFTGRQFTNDEVYRAGFAQQEIRHANEFTLGIYHYVRMRYDSARSQLATLRRTYPAGASGADFTGTLEPLPK